MTPLQNLWLTIFNFGPAVFLSIYKQWWVGIVALMATLILSWVLTLTVTMNISGANMTTWAWIKPPIIAATVLVAGWWLF
jgi:hypothetical protein